eukprot:CAMPEP_0202853646 /NCGR_PEP_ID=MMETSP1389-20130828/90586_1 /ASSEMBLY_ACC=CAM_ASM_000865 /TAXON_ID=302021 /ORGANISM="Rhodomonas sp., Strain CCMP768" /LENGTH=172 /DNA_ID=CAMNT_0049532197 /DNA_START=207 /DNA_END=722 /DNA_ORIENTATION=-
MGANANIGVGSPSCKHLKQDSEHEANSEDGTPADPNKEGAGHLAIWPDVFQLRHVSAVRTSMQQSSTSNSAAAGADQSRSLMSNADLGTIQDSVPDTEVESVSTTRSTAGTDSQAADESSASDDSSEDCSGSSSLNLENLQWSPSPHAQTVSASEDALPRSAQGTGAGTGTG